MSLRRQTVKELHASHQGVDATLRRARETLYWPNIKGEIKDHISKCDVCPQFAPKQPKETLISHAIPNRPWAKEATDPFECKQKSYLVTVDYFSNFFEIDRLYDTTTKVVILKLKVHMARYGIPDELVFDQGPQFRSHEFHNFAENYGFRHTLTSPYHHQSNGMAESAVKRAKKVVRVAEATKRDPYLILLDYRNTPQESLDTSPAQRPMSRPTKTTMPTSSKLLDPEIVSGVHEKVRRRQARQQKYYNRGARDLEHLKDGDPVVMQPHALNDHVWRKAHVTRKVGIRSYEVEADGQTYIRNRRHRRKVSPLQSSEVEEQSVDQNTVNQSRDSSPSRPTRVLKTNGPVAMERTVTATQSAATSETPTDKPEIKTRSGRVSLRPKRYQDFVMT